MRRIRDGLLAAVVPVLLVAGGCSSFEEAPDNAGVLAAVQQEQAALGTKFKRDEPLPSIAIAPIHYNLKHEGDDGEEEGVETSESEAEAEAEAAAENALIPDPVFETDGELAVHYRRPLHRQLLFAPIDPDLIDRAPDVRLKPRRAQAEDGVIWICPRCQNDVGEYDNRCEHCGLHMAPEDEPELPGTEVPEPGVEPDVVPVAEPGIEPGAEPVIEGQEGPGEETPAPGTITAEGAQPDAPEVATAAPTFQDPPERFICYFCANEISPSDQLCPHCQVPFYDFDSPVLAGNLAATNIAQGEFNVFEDHAVFSPNLVDLQTEITDLVSQYEVFKEVVALEEYKQADDLEHLLELAAAQNFTLMLRPVLNQCEVKYEGVSTGKWALSAASWVVFWLPSLFVDNENFTVTMEFEFELYHPRSGESIRRWKKNYSKSMSLQVDAVDRGWYPWSVWVPGQTKGAYQEMYTQIMPLVKAEVKKELVREFHKNFVKVDISIPKAPSRRSMAMLVGVPRVEALPEGTYLEFVPDDMEAMTESFKKQSRWIEVQDKKKQDWGEVYRFDKDQEVEFRPNLANLKRFLREDLQKLERPDTFVFYFSGYGAVAPKQGKIGAKGNEEKIWGDGYEKYLCLPDTDPNDFEKTALSLTELKAQIEKAVCRNVIVILDCSFYAKENRKAIGAGGKSFPGLKIEEGVELNDAFLSSLARRANGRCVVFAASDITNAAYESEYFGSDGMSLLTYTFVEGVKGRADTESSGNNDEEVRVGELFDFVQEGMVSTATSLIGVNVEPQILGRRAMNVFLKPKAR